MMTTEKRLIDANALADEVLNHPKPYRRDFYRMLKDAPTIDAVEAVHARWEKEKQTGFLGCSSCWDVFVEEEWLHENRWNYCPNCGAKMDGDGNG